VQPFPLGQILVSKEVKKIFGHSESPWVQSAMLCIRRKVKAATCNDCPKSSPVQWSSPTLVDDNLSSRREAKTVIEDDRNARHEACDLHLDCQILLRRSSVGLLDTRLDPATAWFDGH
jgi:hypothetical protein